MAFVAENRSMKERLRKLRTWLEVQGITQRDLAESLGVHPSMITRIFKGERTPPDRIAALVKLGIPPHLLPPPNQRGPGRPRKNSK